MNDTQADVQPADSSTASDVSPAASSPAPDVQQSESSTDGGQEETFDQRVERLESGIVPAKKTEASPAAEPKTESDAKPVEGAKKDEPAPDTGKAPDKALSQQDEVLNKAFDARPEWKKALSLVPKERHGEMRETMRAILGRENQVAAEVEQRFKPVAEKFDRLRSAVGDDVAVENTIALTELFQRGDPKAREMLVNLLNDLDTRTGNVLTSPDLLTREAAVRKRLTDGVIDEADAQQQLADLKELQKARAGEQQTQTQIQARQQAELKQRFEAQQTELTTACESWEAVAKKSEPDYASLKEMVEQRAFVVGNERQAKLKSRLLNGTEMKAVLNESLTWAKAEAAKFRPAPKAHQPITDDRSSITSRRAPTNPKEAFDQSVEKYESKL